MHLHPEKRRLGLDLNSLDQSLCAFTLAPHEARELGLGHAHWLSPVLCDPIPDVPPSDYARDILGKLVNDVGGVCAGAQIPYQIRKSNPATPASAIVGTSGSKVDRRAVVTPKGNSLSSLRWVRVIEKGAIMYIVRPSMSGPENV